MAFDDPETVMESFSKWLADHTKGRPVFVSDDAAFDWQFTTPGRSFKQLLIDLNQIAGADCWPYEAKRHDLRAVPLKRKSGPPFYLRTLRKAAARRNSAMILANTDVSP